MKCSKLKAASSAAVLILRRGKKHRDRGERHILSGKLIRLEPMVKHDSQNSL